MVGIQLISPAPEFAPDEIPPFDIKVAGTDLVGTYPQGPLAEADGKWKGKDAVKGAQQWIDVQNTWLNPSDGIVAAQSVADMWVAVLNWKGMDGKGIKLDAAAPHLLLGDLQTFETYYLEAPKISVG